LNDNTHISSLRYSQGSTTKMDKNNPNKEHRSTPEYAEYQADNFWASNDGKVPLFNTGTLLHVLESSNPNLRSTNTSTPHQKTPANSKTAPEKNSPKAAGTTPPPTPAPPLPTSPTDKPSTDTA
jgi:hypothetical protein